MDPTPEAQTAPVAPVVAAHPGAAAARPVDLGHAPSRRSVRWMDTAISLLLCGAVATVLFVATPPILRAAGLGPTATNGVGTARSVRGGGRAEPKFFEGDDELDPRGPRPHGRTLPGWPRDDEEERADNPTDNEPPNTDPARMGLVRQSVKLFDQPGGEAIGEVRSGEVVMLVKEAGEWVLVVHSGENDLSMGWTRRSDIAVR